MFCLFYNAKTKKIHALNGSGRYAANSSLEQVRRDLGLTDADGGSIPLQSALAATTPGAAAGWVDTVEKFGSGKLSLEQILTPAIELAEQGFPVSELSSSFVSFPILKGNQPQYDNDSFDDSGKREKNCYAMHRQIIGKCSSLTLPPQTA